MQLVGISATGKVALTTEFFGGGSDPKSGVYVADTAGPTLIAFEDTPTPVPGKFFRGFLADAMTMNDAGQLAFVADLSDVENGPSTGRGLYLYDTAGGLQQIARTGDAIDGSTISNVYFFGTVTPDSVQSPDTSHSGLNSAGQIAFAFSLANGQDRIGIWSPDVLAGDYNGDKVVDGQDYQSWRAAFGTNAAAADGNENGSVDAADYVIWHRAVQAGAGMGAADLASSSATAAVPEPSALLLLFGCLMGACLTRSRAVAHAQPPECVATQPHLNG